MHVSRVLTTVALATAAVGLTLSASTAASAQGSGNSGHATVSAKPFHPKVSPNASVTKINHPNDQYVAHTCKFDISGIADGTMVDSLDACGITATFSVSLEKVSVSGGTWGTWGSPPDTESATPDALWLSDGSTSLTVTFSEPVRIAGAEAEPDPFGVHPFAAAFTRPGGGTKVTIARDIDGNAGARLLAVKTKNVGSVTLSSDVDFAIAQLRVNL
jgi:hypothetical protein